MSCNTIITNLDIKIMETKINAAKKLLPVYNSMETRKVKLSTLYRRLYRSGDVWRCSGVGYDYTV